MTTLLVLIDNYDSFVYNLARYFERLGVETVVIRNDATTIENLRKLDSQAIVISPGPCTPREAGISLEVVRELGETTPILGVCLGHQVIAQALGAAIVRAKTPMHGRSSPIRHDRCGLFHDLPNPLQVGRYHSLIVDEASLPSELSITATTNDGTIMAIAHSKFHLFGLQFHPESILTECGYQLLANFLSIAEVEHCSDSGRFTSELRTKMLPVRPEPAQPVTF